MVIDELKSEKEIDDFPPCHLRYGFYDDIASRNPLSNIKVQTATACRRDRCAGAYVLIPLEGSCHGSTFTYRITCVKTDSLGVYYGITHLRCVQLHT